MRGAFSGFCAFVNGFSTQANVFSTLADAACGSLNAMPSTTHAALASSAAIACPAATNPAHSFPHGYHHHHHHHHVTPTPQQK